MSASLMSWLYSVKRACLSWSPWHLREQVSQLRLRLRSEQKCHETALQAINNQLSRTIAANRRAWENQVRADVFAEYLPPSYVKRLNEVVASHSEAARGLYKPSITIDPREIKPTPTKPIP